MQMQGYVNVFRVLYERIRSRYLVASAILVGSLLPDIDHFILLPFRTSYDKMFAHEWKVYVIIIAVCFVSYFSRRIKIGNLKQNEVEYEKA